MTGAVVTVGDELLQGIIQDTNTPYLEGVLLGLGIEPVLDLTVGDVREDISQALVFAMGRARVVVVTGGLGPTEDDVTREAIAGFCGLPLEFNPEAWKWIRERIQVRGTILREDHKRQAMFPKGAVLFPNRAGTAWGFGVHQNDGWIIAMPGIPREMKVMMEGEVIPFLLRRLSLPTARRIRVLKTFGLKESEVNALLRDLMKRYPRHLGLMVREYGEVHVKIQGDSSTVDKLEDEVRKLLQQHIYGQDGDTLEAVIGNLLREQGLTISTAESCTGGMLAHTITNAPGSSDYFLAGFVTYTSEMKHKVLGVPQEILERYTAVSEETALHMVRGLVERTGTDIGIATTGIAGPAGGSSDRPVGLVYVGYAIKGHTKVVEYRFHTDRLGVKTLTVKSALDHVRRALIKGNAK